MEARRRLPGSSFQSSSSWRPQAVRAWLRVPFTVRDKGDILKIHHRTRSGWGLEVGSGDAGIPNVGDLRVSHLGGEVICPRAPSC